MRVFRAVVEIPALARSHAWITLVLCGTKAREFVIGEDPWDICTVLKEPAQELLGRHFVATALEDG